MGIVGWTWIIVGASFALYIAIAFWAKAKTTGDFYVAEKSIHPVLNGMATGADWMSAASFISMAGLISFMGRDGSQYLMGWTGGYTLLAILLAPYLRKYGKYTVPQFVGDRYYSSAARVVALTCAIFISFTYVAGQMRGVGIVFSRFLETSIDQGVVIGMILVFFYATLGGMKGITYTQVAQYCVLIFAYMVPAIFISMMLTDTAIPQLGFGSSLSSEGARLLGAPPGTHLLRVLDQITVDLGFPRYTAGRPGYTADVFAITLCMMVGTAGLPHIIIRFFTVPKIRDARSSAGWALLFIAILYTTAPAVAAFARTNFIKSVNGTRYADAPSWFKNWERTRLVAFDDKNGDGVMTYSANREVNEVAVDRDIVVLASPEIARLPAWVVALVAAGGLAAALSTAAGLLLVISAAISHDLMKGVLTPRMTEKQELFWARLSAGAAVLVSGYFGINPPGFVAEVVALAFGLAASSFFPVLVMGVFWKRATKEGAMAGMLCGIGFTAAYIVYFKFVNPAANTLEHWWWGISPEGIGTIGMLVNFAVTSVVSLVTKAPPQEVQDMVASLRYPKEATPGRAAAASKAAW
ncbi:MAG TPA: sodium:solute symporter family protein [Anaeromyxobacteraceae bacterium]|nr:sodium:solute symporter family protein [Anaeromyxobacteraceae bacterium]